ncbi:unnamed protein product, partial [Ectocarpus fasciculatus]
ACGELDEAVCGRVIHRGSRLQIPVLLLLLLSPPAGKKVIGTAAPLGKNAAHEIGGGSTLLHSSLVAAADRGTRQAVVVSPPRLYAKIDPILLAAASGGDP